MHRICAVTATRAEYGIMSPLLKKLNNHPQIDLELLVTGTHLVSKYGMTVKQIEEDGFENVTCVEILEDDDSKLGILKTMSNAQLKVGEQLSKLKPELLIVLGDRYELIPIVSSAVVLNIPVCHLHGGEISEGAIDDLFRHAVSKMSMLHFPATEEYRQRLIRMGENPNNVFNYGSLGVENVKKIQALSQCEISNIVGFDINKHTMLVTFHPVTTETDSQLTQFKELLSALDELDNSYSFIFTRPNSDTGREALNRELDLFASSHKCYVSDSLGLLKYLSAMKYCGAVVGNSSSGIIEAPSYHVATIDIGNRQKGRTAAKSVVHAEAKKEDILAALKLIETDNFKKELDLSLNPYEGDNTAINISNKIFEYVSKPQLKTKPFYDFQK